MAAARCAASFLPCTPAVSAFVAGGRGSVGRRSGAAALRQRSAAHCTGGGKARRRAPTMLFSGLKKALGGQVRSSIGLAFMASSKRTTERSAQLFVSILACCCTRRANPAPCLQAAGLASAPAVQGVPFADTAPSWDELQASLSGQLHCWASFVWVEHRCLPVVHVATPRAGCPVACWAVLSRAAVLCRRWWRPNSAIWTPCRRRWRP